MHFIFKLILLMQLQNLEPYLIYECPSKAYYIPEFISRDEEFLLLDHVNNVPKPKWTQLMNRRLQNWGGLPHIKGMVPEEIPSWLKDYCMKIYDLSVFKNNLPNHILINEYLPGQGTGSLIKNMNDFSYNN